VADSEGLVGNQPLVLNSSCTSHCLCAVAVSCTQAHDFRLVVFDEAHHADGQHTYARIIRNFLPAALPGPKHPPALPQAVSTSNGSNRSSYRLLGLTASPFQLLSKETQGGEKPCSLEVLLNGHIVTAPNM
jgi:hypothetical protein